MIGTTIITPSVGSEHLMDACTSVASQSANCLHLIVSDGPAPSDQIWNTAMDVKTEIPSYNVAVMTLPWNVGGGGNYGHRIYAAIPSLVDTPFFSFLDEDNMIGPRWVQKMERALHNDQSIQFVTCRRKVVREDGSEIGLDNCESIGENDMGYRLYDTNTWLFRSSMSILAPYISLPYHRNDKGSWGGDRSLTEAVWKVPHRHIENYHGTIYRAPERLYKFFEENCDA